MATQRRIVATIDIIDQSLVVHIEGIDKILSLRSTLTVPLAHIRSVSAPADATALMVLEGGARFWGVQRAGTLLVGTLVLPDDEGYVFCDVRDPTRALGVELHHDRFRRLFIELSDETPASARARIETAVARIG